MNYKVKFELVHNGLKFLKDDILDGEYFTKKQKERLVFIGAIEETHEPKNVDDEEAEALNEESDELPAPPELPEGDFEELTDDDVKEELEKGFTHSELVKEMEHLDMEFKKNESKERLINLILEEEKDEHFLDLLEGR